MAQLLVRNIPREIVDALRRRAVVHGRSAEAEHREILRAALLRRKGPSFKEHLLGMPGVGDDADFVFDRGRPREVDL